MTLRVQPHPEPFTGGQISNFRVSCSASPPVTAANRTRAQPPTPTKTRTRRRHEVKNTMEAIYGLRKLRDSGPGRWSGAQGGRLHKIMIRAVSALFLSTRIIHARPNLDSAQNRIQSCPKWSNPQLSVSRRMINNELIAHSRQPCR